MKITRRRWWVVAIGFAVAACAAPFLPLSFLRPRVERALSGKLGRRVEIGNVSLTLFTGPGLALSNVTIHEDPRAGIEPFVYAETADARVDLLALIQGRRGFSSLRLVDATLNLVKTETGVWNFQYLNEARLEDAPAVHLRAARVNLKIGQTKSVLYFDGADLDMSLGHPGAVNLQFSGVPGRTDHPAQNFGQLFVRGSWVPSAADHPLNISVQLEPSSFDGVANLFGRSWFDLQGQVALTAQLTGVASRMKVNGEIQLDEGRRSDFLPHRDAKWKLPYRGTLDFTSETLRLENAADGKENVPVAVSLEAANVASPQWTASIDLNDAPLAVMVDAAHRVAALLPEKFSGEGTVSGHLQYEPQDGLAGTVEVHDAAVALPDSPALKAAVIPVRIAAQMVTAGPVLLSLGGAQNAQVEASYKFDGSLAADVKMTTRGVDLAALRAFGSAPLLDRVVFDPNSAESKAGEAKNAEENGSPKSREPAAADSSNPVPPDLAANRGMWRGTLHYRFAGGEPIWTGDYSVENTRILIDGIADPIRVQSASVSAAPQRLAVTRIKASAGDVAFTGEYRFDKTGGSQTSAHKASEAKKSGEEDADGHRPLAHQEAVGAAQPHTFKLQIAEASAAELDRLFKPSLAHGGGFLQRTIRLGGNSPAPDWLLQRKAEGSVSIAKLIVGDREFKVDAPYVRWEGALVELSPLNARMLDAGLADPPGELTADLAIDLSQAAAQYRLQGKVTGLPYKGGRVDFDGLVEAAGEGAPLLASLHASGTLSGRAIAFAHNANFRTVSGLFEGSFQGASPRWKFTDLEVTQGNEVYKGEGATQADGQILLDLKNLGKPVHFTAPLASAAAH
jgi:hypothetical protein